MKRLLLFSLKFTLLFSGSVFGAEPTHIHPENIVDDATENAVKGVKSFATRLGDLSREVATEIFSHVEHVEDEDFEHQDNSSADEETCNQLENKFGEILNSFKSDVLAENPNADLNIEIRRKFSGSDFNQWIFSEAGVYSVSQNDYQQRLAHAVGHNLGKTVGETCLVGYTGNNGEFCEKRKDGDIKEACMKFHDRFRNRPVENNDELDIIAQEYANDAISETEHVREMYNKNQQRRNQIDGEGNVLVLTDRFGQKHCLNNGASCYFTEARGNAVTPKKSCEDVGCNLIGAESADIAGSQNVGLFSVMSLLNSPDTSLHHLGDESFCNDCLNEKYSQLGSDKSWSDAKDESLKAVNDKLIEKGTKRALFDLANHIETVQDLVGIARFASKQTSALPNNVFCESSFDEILNKEQGVFGDECPTSQTERQNLVRSALESMGINVGNGNLSGSKIVKAMSKKTNEISNTPTCSSDTKSGLSGREKFAISKLASWNNDHAYLNEREAISDLMDSMMKINDKTVFTKGLDRVCDGEIPADTTTVEYLSNYVASAIDTFEKRGFDCNSQNIEFGFINESILKRAMCTGDNYLYSVFNNSEEFDLFINSYPQSIRLNLDANKEKIKKEFIKAKTKELLDLGMDMDPRYALKMGSWEDLCKTREAVNSGSEKMSFEDQLNKIELANISKNLENLSKSSCGELAKNLNNLVCKAPLLDPKQKIGYIGGLPFNSEDIKSAVQDLAEDKEPSEVIALGSISCSLRTNMLKDDAQDISHLSHGTARPIIDGVGNRNDSIISDLEQNTNRITSLSSRPNLDGYKATACTQQCSTEKNAYELLGNSKSNYKCNYDDEHDQLFDYVTNNNNGTGALIPGGNTNGGTGADPGFVSKINGDINGADRGDSGQRSTPFSSGEEVTGPIGGIDRAPAGQGLNGNIGESSLDETASVNGPSSMNSATNLLGFADNDFGQVPGASNESNAEAGYSPMISQDVMDQIIKESNEEVLTSKDKIDSGLDINNLSEDQIKALSESMGIDFDNIKNENQVNKKEDLQEDSALSQLIKSMESQQKSNQEIIDELRNQNKALTNRLSNIESAAKDATSYNPSSKVVGGNASQGEAFKSSSYAYDMANNRFVNKSTITGDERSSFSPDFSGGSDFKASNYSSYSGARRSAMRSTSSDINQEFLTLIAGKEGSFANVQSSAENVGKYVEFVKEKGSIYQLVKYNEQGEPISIKVPWSDEEISLEGELAVLKSQIPPQDEAIEAEESDYGLYKMVEFNQSLQAFFANESKEQVQLSSLINILEEAEE